MRRTITMIIYSNSILYSIRWCNDVFVCFHITYLAMFILIYCGNYMSCAVLWMLASDVSISFEWLCFNSVLEQVKKYYVVRVYNNCYVPLYYHHVCTACLCGHSQCTYKQSYYTYSYNFSFIDTRISQIAWANCYHHKQKPKFH